MRDDDEGALVRVDERLEPPEPVEVEVVRRLVEEQDVEPREQDRRERRAGCLAAREPSGVRMDADFQPELGAGRASAGLEVAAAEREERLQRGGVPLLPSRAESKRS